MSSSRNANTYNRQNWEESEFPILCETCLGDNTNIRMTKERFGKECKICKRPFTIFRWQAGTRGRYKKTEICQICAKVKNVCQTCILDLQFGLPVEARDQALRVKQNLPRGVVNREYNHQQLEVELENNKDGLGLYAGVEAAGGKMQKSNEMLLKMARPEPYYKRNRAHICSFYVKGLCKRGEECPYRHERPSDPDDPLSQQNITDRYYGVNDPVAANLLEKSKKIPRPIPPEDKSVTTLHLGGVTEQSGITETDLRNTFYQYGEIRSVSIPNRQKCAFIEFTSRDAAEKAVDKTFDKLIINGTRINVNWGRSSVPKESHSLSAGLYNLPMVPGLPPPLTGYHQPIPTHYLWPGMAQSSSNMPPPPPPPPIDKIEASSLNNIHYPSQDPNRLGGIKK